MENNFESIEDIDAQLDKEFNLNGENDTNMETEETNETENEITNDEEQTETAENTADTANNTAETSTETIANNQKHSAEDKKAYSFEQLRRENTDLKNKLKGVNASEDALKRIASNYGYESAEDFVKAYDEALMKQEAEKKGYDPVLYSELQKSNRRIAELEEENKQTKLFSKANEFRNAIDNTIKEYNLGEDGRDEIFNRLEKAGYTVDTILNLPDASIVIKGVLADKIAEVSKQSQIDKMDKLNNIADNKHSDSANEEEFDLDKLIALEMKQYKADNFYE